MSSNALNSFSFIFTEGRIEAQGKTKVTQAHLIATEPGVEYCLLSQSLFT